MPDHRLPRMPASRRSTRLFFIRDDLGIAVRPRSSALLEFGFSVRCRATSSPHALLPPGLGRDALHRRLVIGPRTATGIVAELEEAALPAEHVLVALRGRATGRAPSRRRDPRACRRRRPRPRRRFGFRSSAASTVIVPSIIRYPPRVSPALKGRPDRRAAKHGRGGGIPTHILVLPKHVRHRCATPRRDLCLGSACASVRAADDEPTPPVRVAARRRRSAC